jgi:hypothetical protein
MVRIFVWSVSGFPAGAGFAPSLAVCNQAVLIRVKRREDRVAKKPPKRLPTAVLLMHVTLRLHCFNLE